MVRRSLAGGLALLIVGVGAGGPAPKGKDRVTPIGWFRFDGDAANAGAGKATFTLKNTEFKDNALALNGRYNGSDAAGYTAECATPTLDYTGFTVAVRAKAADFDDRHCQLLVGGPSYRWFGLVRSGTGHLTVTFNNGDDRHDLKGPALEPGEWFVVACAVDLPKRTVKAYVNGKAAGEVELPKDFALRVATSDARDRDKGWTFTNYSNRNVFHGLVDELLIYDRALTPDELAAVPLKK